MTAPWCADDLGLLQAAPELEVAVRNDDGSLRPWVPIWVVCAGGQVYVRTWYRRHTGWFGRALTSHRARIRVPGVEADVSMVTAEAAATTLRVHRDWCRRAVQPASPCTSHACTTV